MVIQIKLEGFTNQIIGLVSGKERSEYDLPIYCCECNGVIQNHGAHFLLYFLDIRFRELNESSPKEDIFRIEIGMEAYSFICYVNFALKHYFANQCTGMCFYELFFLLKTNFCF